MPDGRIARVAPAQTQPVPFIAAPLLPFELLDQVKFLRATRAQKAPKQVSGFSVIGYDWFSKLSMSFHTVEGCKVYVDHGLAHLECPLANGTLEQEPICSANVTCSAFEVNLQDGHVGINVGALLDESFTLLDAAADSVRWLMVPSGGWDRS